MVSGLAASWASGKSLSGLYLKNHEVWKFIYLAVAMFGECRCATSRVDFHLTLLQCPRPLKSCPVNILETRVQEVYIWWGHWLEGICVNIMVWP